MFWVCDCSFGYQAWNTHASYCHLWPAQLYNNFPHYPINGTIFGRKLLNSKCVFWFSLQLLSETFLILRRTERDMIIKRISVFMNGTHYSAQILMRFEFSPQICEKFWNIKFHETPSIVHLAVARGRTDGPGGGDSQIDIDKLIWPFFAIFRTRSKFSHFVHAVYFFIVFIFDPTTNRHDFPIQSQVICLFNGDRECLLRGKK